MLKRLILAVVICLNGCSVFAQSQAQTQSLSPEQLYKKAWGIAKDSYVDKKFNGQDWGAWEHKYDGKLLTSDDAHKAIAAMLSSLSDNQTRLLEPNAPAPVVKTEPQEPQTTLTAQKLPHDIGYLRLNKMFSRDLTTAVSDALSELQTSNSLILDLRGNSGGLLMDGGYISNLFVNSGILFSILDPEGYKNPQSSQPSKCVYSKPIVVLIDSDTANSAELIAAALRDDVNAKLVGNTSAGLNRISAMNKLPDGTIMRIAIACWLTPKGVNISGHGLEPDFAIPTPDKSKGAWFKTASELNPSTLNKDAQLEKAYALLNK